MTYIVCVTGASGVVLGFRLVAELGKRTSKKIVLVISKWGWRVARYEVPRSVIDLAFKYVSEYYSEHELDAPIASGSNMFDSVVVAPCTLKTLSDIAYSRSSNLITRVVEVAFKEGRKVIIVPRETPLDKNHVKLLYRVAKRGAYVVPPIAAFYAGGGSLEETVVRYILSKVLRLLGIEDDLYPGWRSSV